MTQDWKWAFFGFESREEGKPVQVWFDGLPEDHQEEIADLIRYLQRVNNRLWRKPEFDPLIGAGGISEVRPEVRSEEGAFAYRMYGYFGPNEYEYTFLHAKNKDVKNDRHGKKIGKRRFDQLANGNATVHRFDF